MAFHDAIVNAAVLRAKTGSATAMSSVSLGKAHFGASMLTDSIVVRQRASKGQHGVPRFRRKGNFILGLVDRGAIGTLRCSENGANQ